MQPVYVESTDDRIRGWYLTDSDLDPSDWTFSDSGNGPEVVTPEAIGPFASEAEAWRLSPPEYEWESDGQAYAEHLNRDGGF